MKKLTFLFLLLHATVLISQDTIPNAGFETWYSNTAPANWQTTNQFFGVGIYNVNKTSDSFEGDFAMKLKTIDLDGLLVPGVATTGILDMGFTYGGIPFTGRPLKFSAAVKHPSSGDEVMFYAAFMKNGELIGEAHWATTDSIGSYMQIEVPVFFYSVENPDTLNITILTDPFIVGSSLSVDALSFEYQTTSLSEIFGIEVGLYPNPAGNFVKISGVSEVHGLRVIDFSGSVVLKSDHLKAPVIDCSHFSRGIYYVTFYSDSKRYSGKLIKD